MQRLALLGAVLVAGCFSKPSPFTAGGDDAGTDDASPGEPLVGVTVTGDGVMTETVVATSDLALQFPIGGMKFPNSLRIGTTDVLGHVSGCMAEDGVGLAAYPVFAVSSVLGPALNPSSSLDVIARGPAFARVHLHWSGGINCGAGTVAEGDTSFTVFPDGRVVRDDTITPGLSALPAPGSTCGCLASEADIYLTSFLTLADAQFTSIHWSGGQQDVGLSDTWIDDPNPRWACLQRGTTAQPVRRLGVAWNDVTTGQDRGTRIKPEIGSQITTLIFDWSHGATMIAPTAQSAQSAWFVKANAGCDAMPGLAAAFDDAPALTVQDDAETYAVPLDVKTGIYDQSTHGASSTYTITPAGPAILAGHAIGLIFPTTGDLTVTRNGQTLIAGRDYLTQSVLVSFVHQHTLWFPTTLAMGSSLTITQP